MRIAVMGAGGLGGYIGARLAAADEDVAFVARGHHLAAMRSDGLRIESPYGNLHLPKVVATDAPADLGAVDLVLFTVKLWDTDAAAALADPLVGPGTLVVTLQNGIGQRRPDCAPPATRPGPERPHLHSGGRQGPGRHLQFGRQQAPRGG